MKGLIICKTNGSLEEEEKYIIYQDDYGNEIYREVGKKNEIHTPSSDLEMMRKNASEMANNKWILLYFADNVQTGGKWDFKDVNNPEHRSFYWFKNNLVTAEEFGNIHYGYVGAAGGFSIELLKDIPGIIQIYHNTARLSFMATNFDDPRDTFNIISGYQAYDESIISILLSENMNYFYTKSIQTAVKTYTSLYFLGKSVIKRWK